MSDLPEALKQLIAKWRAPQNEGEPIGSKGAFTHEIEVACANDVEAAWPRMEAQVRLNTAKEIAGAECELCRQGVHGFFEDDVAFHTDPFGTSVEGAECDAHVPRHKIAELESALAALQDQLKEKK